VIEGLPSPHTHTGPQNFSPPQFRVWVVFFSITPAASTSEGRDNDPVDSAVRGLVAARICAAGVVIRSACHDLQRVVWQRPLQGLASSRGARIQTRPKCPKSGTW